MKHMNAESIISVWKQTTGPFTIYSEFEPEAEFGVTKERVEMPLVTYNNLKPIAFSNGRAIIRNEVRK